jgi:hypothetical protein
LRTAAVAWITGGLLYALSPRGDVEHRYFYSTRPPGVVSMIAGAAVALPGLYFWLRPGASSVATVAPLSGGAAVGWAGRL